MDVGSLVTSAGAVLVTLPLVALAVGTVLVLVLVDPKRPPGPSPRR